MKSSASHRGMGRVWRYQVYLGGTWGQVELRLHHCRLSGLELSTLNSSSSPPELAWGSTS